MSDKKPEDVKKEETDAELSELLDSALADFTKKPEEKKTETKEEDKDAVPAEQEWTNDFIMQAAEQFENNLAALLGGSAGGSDAAGLTNEQIQASLQRMAQAAQEAIANPGLDNPAPNNFASAITQTIQGLSQGTENLQNPFSEADIMNMISGIQGPEGQNSFLPFMQGMMQTMLSKDVLYPSFKDILEKFPVFLTENDAKLSEEDKTRYRKQQELMQTVCTELEAESETDSAEVKKARFDKILSLMQSLQDYGQPPTEIVGDVEVPFDPAGNQDQCSLM